MLLKRIPQTSVRIYLTSHAIATQMDAVQCLCNQFGARRTPTKWTATEENVIYINSNIIMQPIQSYIMILI